MKQNRKIVGHLEGDIKGFRKEREYLKKEIEEDKALVKEIRNKNDKKKNSPSKAK